MSRKNAGDPSCKVPHTGVRLSVHMGGPNAVPVRSPAVLTKRGQCEACGEYERLRIYQDGRYVCADCRRRFDKYGPPQAQGVSG